MKTDFDRKNSLAKEKERLTASLDTLKGQYEIAAAVFERRNYSTDIKRRLADELIKPYGLSLRRACRILQMARTVYYYGEGARERSGGASTKVRRVAQQEAHRSSASLADDLFALWRGD
jgi:hypothetical protein